ncbi:hypothetical protein WA171_003691, partial [Blastocystis sp. BT1]
QSISIHNFKHSSSDKQSIHIYFIFHILTDQRRTILWKKSLYPTILTIPIVDNYVYKDGLLHKESEIAKSFNGNQEGKERMKVFIDSFLNRMRRMNSTPIQPICNKE